jgi:hypothetical protein
LVIERLKKWGFYTGTPICVIEFERKFDMQNHKRHYILISMMFFLCLLLAALTFGREYSTETMETSTEKSAPRPSRSSPTKASPQTKRSAVTYSTETITEGLSGEDSDATTTGTRDHTVSRTRMVPREPRRPQTPNVPKAPEAVDYGGDYPVVGGSLHIRPGPYLAPRCGVRRAFWPGLWDADISYSWSGDSGRGEFTYWPYGYRYSWGGAVDSDDSGHYQALSKMESEARNQRNDTLSGDGDIHSSDNRPVHLSDANELPQDMPVSEAAAQPRHKAAKDR